MNDLFQVLLLVCYIWSTKSIVTIFNNELTPEILENAIKE